MKVLVDGKELDLPKDATVTDALGKIGTTLIDGTILGIVKGRSEKSLQTNSYWLNTIKGRLRIELLDTELQKIWHDNVDKITGSEVKWDTADGISFGPFATTLLWSRDAHEYDRWQVVLGAAGFEAQHTQLIFIRKRHTSVYGSPKDGGVLAKIVGGKNTLDRLGKSDKILGIEPIVEWQDLTEKLTTRNFNMQLEDGMEIFTHIEVELIMDAPKGAEFFLALTRDNTFKVDSVSSSYISSDQLLTERISFEHREPRLEGFVTIRAAGRGLGRIFIYKADRTSNPSHSVVARVTSGMDLIKLAEPGQMISIIVRPNRIMLMGLGLRQALQVLRERGIQAEVDGPESEDAVVVRQEPSTTMDIIKQNTARLTTMPAKSLVAVELFYDKAPKSIDYFRHVTGLKEKPVGPLPVYFVYENTVLFKPEIEAISYKELLPENKPVGSVPAASISVSNQVAKKIGLVGVRLVEDKRYGPSGEKFEATNIIGRVLEPEKLEDLAEGDTVYILEVRK
ncbi:MAG: methanogenesis marker 3 protein [Methanotrichaceae archaeon]|nr:methanogenesis marker 3 protein [Methanotrichaceae archaeon]